MSSGICYTGGEYEPESYKEMKDDLIILENRYKSISRQGKRPGEDNIGYYLNLLYSDDGLYEDCPFCYIKSYGEVIVIRTRDEYALERLNKDLKRQQRNIENRGKWFKELRDKRKISPTILKCKKVQGKNTHDGDPYCEITFSYNIAKNLVLRGVSSAIDNQKEYMQEVQIEFEDYPLVEIKFKKLKAAMSNVMDALETHGDAEKCDMVIQALKEQAREIREWRDEEYNHKIEDYKKVEGIKEE